MSQSIQAVTTKTPETERLLNTKHLFRKNARGWEVQDHCTGRFSFWWGPFLIDGTFLMYTEGVVGWDRKCFGAPFMRAQISWLQSPHYLIMSKTPTSLYHHTSDQISTCESWKDTDTETTVSCNKGLLQNNSTLFASLTPNQVRISAESFQSSSTGISQSLFKSQVGRNRNENLENTIFRSLCLTGSKISTRTLRRKATGSVWP